MGVNCVVKGCRSEPGQIIAKFSPPKDDAEFAKWQAALVGLTKKPLKSCSAVCEKHFDDDCVYRFHEISLPDGVTIYQQRNRKKLKPHSVPFTKYQDPKGNPIIPVGGPRLEAEQTADETKPAIVANVENVTFDHDFITQPRPKPKISFDQLQLPSTDWKVMSNATEGKLFLCDIIFSVESSTFCSRKTVEVDIKERTVNYRIGDDRIESDSLETEFASAKMLEQMLKQFHQAALCQGNTEDKFHALGSLPVPSGSFNNGTWRSKGCLRILERDTSSQRDSLPLCYPCRLLRRLLSNRAKSHKDGRGVDVTKSTRNAVLSREELLEKLAAVTKEKRILAKKINRNAKKTKVAQDPLEI